MKSDVFSKFRTLRSKAYNSYWERRILAEVGYLIELLYDKGGQAKCCLDQAVEKLYQEYLENDQLCVQVAKDVENDLLFLSEEAKAITMICAAHAHIDMNWMWGYQETVALTIDTVRTILTLMEEYPEFKFSQSQASVYHILERYAPAVLDQVKQRVKEGRWEVIASSWVENDKNMSGGESMARHLLCTKKYLSELLDISEDSLNLDFEPDTFGHSRNIPEILRNGGVSRYYHCRGYDGENIYRWRAPSGAEVLVYREPTWYLSFIDAAVCEGMALVCKKYGIDRILNVYGVGDHGGGPTRRDLDRLQDMAKWPLFPTIKFGTYKEFYDYLEERIEQFPVVDQELNYVFTGCYTSQSRIKMANSIGENRLLEAETLESLAKLELPDYQRKNSLEEAWRKQLFNQFHDILPGSGTIETREYAMGEFQEIVAQAGVNALDAMNAICYKLDGDGAKPVADIAMGAGAGFGTDYIGGFGFPNTEQGSGNVRYMALFNVTQEQRNDPVELVLWDWQEELQYTRITDADGNECPFEVLEEGTAYWWHTYCKLKIWIQVPAMGYTICRIDTRSADSIPYFVHKDPRVDRITDEPIRMENNKLCAVFDPLTMKCTSLISKETGEVLITPGKPACGLVLATEDAGNDEMTSWRVGSMMSCVDLNQAQNVRPIKKKTSGNTKEISYEIKMDDTIILAEVSLDENCAYMNFRFNVVWTKLGSKEKGVPQLRFMLPCGYVPKSYKYTVPFGVVERKPLAQDVPATGLGCAVPDNGTSALYLVCNTKYGFRGDRDGLSLNLIRSSFDPDPYPEVGEHRIHLAVGVCEPEESTLAKISAKSNHPVITRTFAGSLQQNKNLIRVEGGIVSAVKNAEDGNGFIIRVFNPTKEDKQIRVEIPGKRIRTQLCDFLECSQTELTETFDEAQYMLGCNKVCTIRVITE